MFQQTSIGTLEKLEDLTVWDRLLARSPQRTRFLDREFLDHFGVSVSLYGYFKKGVCIAGVPVIDATPLGFEALPWSYYQGPIYFDEIYRSSPSRLTQYEIELGEDLITQLAVVEPTFNLSLHPSITDIRGFDWVHYHNQNKPRVTLSPRYTAVVDLSQTSMDELRSDWRSSRRQETGYAVSRETLSVHKVTTCENLIALYHDTFAKQGETVPDNELEALKTYCAYFEGKAFANILEIRDASSKAVAATLIFEDYCGTWHVPLVGVGDTRYGGTLLYSAILEHALEAGGKYVDFNGANSPKRAYFKHSMGAKPLLYFELSYNESGK